MNDPRYNAEKGDAFADGHRLVTSPIIAVKNGEYHTADTIYTLDEAAKNTDFKEWCEKNQYKEVPLDGVWEKNEEQGSVVLRHICENCGKEQILSSEEGYTQGWDYPPKMVFLKSYRRGLVASRYRNHTLVGNSVQQDSFRPVR
jgi:ferredoxin-like protein FixX